MNSIGKEAGESLYVLLKQSENIEVLKLIDVSLHESDIIYIAKSFGPSMLRSLTLNSINLSEKSQIELFNSFKDLKHVEYLNLEKMGISGESASILFNQLSFISKLSTLILDNNALKMSVKYLSKVIEYNQHLSKLTLNNSFIEDAGLLEVADALMKNSCLTVLELNINKITDASCETIKAIFEKNKTITQLYLLKNRIRSHILFKQLNIGDQQRLIMEE